MGLVKFDASGEIVTVDLDEATGAYRLRIGTQEWLVSKGELLDLYHRIGDLLVSNDEP